MWVLRWLCYGCAMWHRHAEVAYYGCAMWQILGWCGPMRCSHVALSGLTGWESVLPCVTGWVRWTNGVLTRGTSGTHLSDMWDPHGWGGPMRYWHVALTCWGGPMRCWHVSHTLSSLILCVYVWDPQFAPRWVSVPKLHPELLWLNLSPWLIHLICFIFPEFILIAPLIQKSWNFYQKSLNSWWSSL
jgi:hypothetical protein